MVEVKTYVLHGEVTVPAGSEVKADALASWRPDRDISIVGFMVKDSVNIDTFPFGNIQISEEAKYQEDVSGGIGVLADFEWDGGQKAFQKIFFLPPGLYFHIDRDEPIYLNGKFYNSSGSDAVASVEVIIYYVEGHR